MKISPSHHPHTNVHQALIQVTELEWYQNNSLRPRRRTQSSLHPWQKATIDAHRHHLPHATTQQISHPCNDFLLPRLSICQREQDIADWPFQSADRQSTDHFACYISDAEAMVLRLGPQPHHSPHHIWP